MISKSITALINRDAALAQRVIANDEEIDRMEVEVAREQTLYRMAFERGKGVVVVLHKWDLVAGDKIGSTQSAVILENLISQFLYSSAEKQGTPSTPKP